VPSAPKPTSEPCVRMHLAGTLSGFADLSSCSLSRYLCGSALVTEGHEDRPLGTRNAADRRAGQRMATPSR
jgi:hypothetical protein